MKNTKPRPVAIVDDDPAMLHSLARLLVASGHRARAFSCANELMAEIDELDPGCVIADLAMPNTSGLELQRALLRSHHPYPIVFLTGRADVYSSVEAMKHGAVDFLDKPVPRGALLEAVDRAMTQQQAARTRAEEHQQLLERLGRLTPRERDVFDQVVLGKMNKQIAGELGITEKTVKVHRARVMQKMGVRSLAELARIAERLESSVAA